MPFLPNPMFIRVRGVDKKNNIIFKNLNFCQTLINIDFLKNIFCQLHFLFDYYIFIAYICTHERNG